MSWADKHIALPYANTGRGPHGWDCWGLVCKVYEEELGLALPLFAGEYLDASEHAEIAALVAAHGKSPIWSKIDVPRSFDLALLRLGPHACHVGIVVAGNRMLHMAHGQRSKIESCTAPRWRDRLLGFYRHAQATGLRS